MDRVLTQVAIMKPFIEKSLDDYAISDVVENSDINLYRKLLIEHYKEISEQANDESKWIERSDALNRLDIIYNDDAFTNTLYNILNKSEDSADFLKNATKSFNAEDFSTNGSEFLPFKKALKALTSITSGKLIGLSLFAVGASILGSSKVSLTSELFLGIASCAAATTAWAIHLDGRLSARHEEGNRKVAEKIEKDVNTNTTSTAYLSGNYWLVKHPSLEETAILNKAQYKKFKAQVDNENIPFVEIKASGFPPSILAKRTVGGVLQSDHDTPAIRKFSPCDKSENDNKAVWMDNGVKVDKEHFQPEVHSYNENKM